MGTIGTDRGSLGSSSGVTITTETKFDKDAVRDIVKYAIKENVGNSQYDMKMITTWSNTILESCLVALSKLQKPFKYIITCVILQRNGAGLEMASSCYWDGKL